MDALPVLPYCAHHLGFKPLSNVRSNVRTRCAERKEEKRETARLESGVSTVAASLSTQPSVAVLPVGLHLQGQRDRKVVETAAEGIHPHISHAGGHNVTSESRGLVPPEAVTLNEGSARKCKCRCSSSPWLLLLLEVAGQALLPAVLAPGEKQKTLSSKCVS